MKRFSVILLLFVLFLVNIEAQNLKYVHQVAKDLCSPKMFGRAAIFNGDSIAAGYLVNEFKKIGLKSFEGNYRQYFTHKATYLKEASVELGKGNFLKPEDDYYALGFSPSCDLEIKDERPIFVDDSAHWSMLKRTKLDNIILVFNSKTMNISVKDMAKFVDTAIHPKLVIFQGYEKINYYIGREELSKFPIIQLVGYPIKEKIDYMKLHIKTEVENEHKTQNVIGYIEGKIKDTFLVFTCHYDALGMMGDALFPGANDNASGVVSVLDLANTFVKSNPYYSIMFICFGAEEIGMLGSHYYVEHPYFPLAQIKLVINLDLVSTGSEGLIIVNGKENGREFNIFEQLNANNRYFYKIIAQNNRCNSDHCAFDKKGVKALFLMTAGAEHPWGHSIYDNYENMHFTRYEGLIELLKSFVGGYK